MPSGDSQRHCFSEMIEILLQQWKPELSWDELTRLTAYLDAMLQQIRKDLNIVPPMCTCSAVSAAYMGAHALGGFR